VRPQPFIDSDPADRSADDLLSPVHARIDGLTERLDRISRTTSGQPLLPKPPETAEKSDPVAEALARLDRRLDQMMAVSRSAAAHIRRPIAPPPRKTAKNDRAYWAEQIATRQRTLDAPSQPEAAAAETWPATAADFADVEFQLHDIAALSHDVAEIGRALTQATPQREIEALQAEVRALADRIDRTRMIGADTPDFSAIEQELSQIRDSLSRLTPAENIAELEGLVRTLLAKIEQTSNSERALQDSAAIGQLESAIASLRSMVSTVASEGTLSQLATEVRGLAEQFERITAESSLETLNRLEARIKELLSNERPPAQMPSPENDRSPADVSSPGDAAALQAIDTRIALIAQKLDQTDERFERLASVERGLADVLAHLKEIDNARPQNSHNMPPVMPPVPAAPGGTQAASRVTTGREQAAGMPNAQPPSEPAPLSYDVVEASPAAAPNIPRPAPREPIDPSLPPNTPLEPGRGISGSKATSAATRIAASEAALGGFRSASAEPGSRSAAIAAARNAARAAYLSEAESQSDTQSKSWLPWRSRRASDKAQQPISKPAFPADHAEGQFESDAPDQGARMAKTALVASSVIIMTIAATHTAVELLFPDAAPSFLSASVEPLSPRPSRSAALPGRAPLRTAPEFDSEMADPVGSISGRPSISAPADVPQLESDNLLSPVPLVPLGTPATPQIASANPPADAPLDKLPSSIGPALRQALAAKNPAALYELGVRFAEGRGVTQNMNVAAGWFEQAAQSGFTPAQFRLASMMEKGEGLKKDPQAASRLYRLAADKGHAKAMHNLAVLHAEGLGGQPDYANAAHWFRRAAAFGIADSQYNLGVLYARGGDADAAKKRDSIAERLDSKSLNEAKQAVKSFVAETEPESATSLKAPSGGWDRAPAAQAKPKR
jgi:localization factor PodJL